METAGSAFPRCSPGGLWPATGTPVPDGRFLHLGHRQRMGGQRLPDPMAVMLTVTLEPIRLPFSPR